MDLPQKGIELRHTIMSARRVATPFGDAQIASRWMRDRYHLLVSGPFKALDWMFPNNEGAFEKISSISYRHAFSPVKAPRLIKVMRELQQICSQFQMRWEERLQNEQMNGGATINRTNTPDNLTLAQLVERYRTARAGELAPATMERDRHYLNRWSREIGTVLIKDLTEDQILTARAAMTQGLKVSTINCVFSQLRTVLRWATARNMMTDDSYRHIKPFRVVRNAREKPWWTMAEVNVALECAEKVDEELHRNPKKEILGTATLLIALGCLLGLRYEEIVMLRWCDIDLNALDITDQTAAPVAHIVPKEVWTPKDGESRAIPIHQRLADILRKYRREEGYVLRAHSQFKKERIGTKRVYRYDPHCIWLRVLQKAIAAGAKKITPHGMRHSFASNLLMAGTSDALIARWLGHSDTSQVHETYGHLLAYHSGINNMRFSSPPITDAKPEQK